ncbi:mesenchyme-specific cell surface glycoprotein isoform X2 [Strongylocentrotus purpuratus]|uniref:Choice-of-anchor I domain-containing protein n=1 Tax=Strongylocentrotus purpuratus TaxID=7668 RepID=A0A7M7HK64_STRPU|nr:mesenchyme-specific cell surface glycoprotein isoform X1 [Strongylocentrotus purpuratus]XP_011675432.2 mesenchyme-specific cell surface glycoprotein isoform X2 [Strongylocentrotus purpuratus]
MDHILHRRLRKLLTSLWLVLLTVSLSAARFTLNPISVLYVPYEFDATTGEGLYGLVKGPSEQSSYDYKNHLLYIAGDTYVQIANISDAANPAIIHSRPVSSSVNDIEVCGDYVGYLENGIAHKNAQGMLHLMRAYNTTSRNWTDYLEIPVGSVPDMLYFTKDCQTIVVVNEGEYDETDVPGVFIDPEGTVSIIRLDSGRSEGYTINHLNFTAFNERAAEYEAKGVRYSYKNSTFSQNLEPEYVAISSDDSTAYIALQENNAIAVINIGTETIEEIYSLGLKSWKDLKLDVSDRDGGIVFRNHDIYSMYQPDAIKYFDVGGTGYIATANEGATVEYPTWTEEKRGKSLVDDGLVWGESPLISALNDTSQLGRLKFSQYEGINASRFGKIDQLVFYGGRSISIRKASDLSLVYDSGDVIEVKSSQELTNVFNTDTKPLTGAPEGSADTRSDDYGPECESLAFAEVNGTRLLFVGIERLSAIAIFTFPSGSAIPEFDSFHRAGGTDRSYDQLLIDREVGDLDPEDIKFLPYEKSPTGKDFLIVTNNIAGTIAFYDVVNNSALRSEAGVFIVSMATILSFAVSRISSVLSIL